MVIAVASGKGGTGKTTIAVSLAQYLAQRGNYSVLVSDADVEAPNAHLFLNPFFSEETGVALDIPQIDLEFCSGCGTCAEVCQFNAVVLLKGIPKVFPTLCHGCGSCSLQCPEGAILEIPHTIAKLERGSISSKLLLRQGLLHQGEPMAVPVIAALRKWGEHSPATVEIVDCPPGASCPVVESLREADFVLLVTEPTPFGLHDLKQAYQVTSELGLKAGVVINRTGLGQADIQGFCQKNGVPVMLEIPLDRKIGEGLARGKSLLDIDPVWSSNLEALWVDLLTASRGEVS